MICVAPRVLDNVCVATWSPQWIGFSPNFVSSTSLDKVNKLALRVKRSNINETAVLKTPFWGCLCPQYVQYA